MPPQPDSSPRGPATARPDPKSANPEFLTPATARLQADAASQATHPCPSLTLRQTTLSRGSTSPILPGGLDLLRDLAKNTAAITLIEAFPAPASATRWRRTDLPPDAYHHTFTTDVSPSVLGKGVTGFSSSQENAVGLTEVWYRFGWKMSCAIRVTNVPMVRTDNLPARRQVTWPPANPCLVSATANLDSAKRLDKTIAFSAPTLDAHHSHPL